MKVDDLPPVEEGDWGMVLAQPDLDGPWSLMYYDDDHQECAYLNPDCGDEDLENEELYCHPECEFNDYAICFPFNTMKEWYHLPHWTLKKLPDSTPPVIHSYGDGFVYAVATIPDITLGRLKIGWTKNVNSRLQQYRTANPMAVLLGVWGATSNDEYRAHDLMVQLKGVKRVGKSEVFDCENPLDVIGALNNLMCRGSVAELP